MNISLVVYAVCYIRLLWIWQNSYLSSLDCQSCHVQWLLGNWGLGSVIPLWRTLLVMNVEKMRTLTKIPPPPKALLYNLLCFSPDHLSTQPCCRMWPEWRRNIDKLDNPDKGLRSLSEQAEGEKNSLLLKDYYLTSRMLDSAQHPQLSERKETNNDWMKELDAVSVWVYGRAPVSNKTTRTEIAFLFHSHWKANQEHIIRIYWCFATCQNTKGIFSKWNQLTKPPSLSLWSASHLKAGTPNFISTPVTQKIDKDTESCPSPLVLCWCFGACCNHSFTVTDWLEEHCIQSMHSIAEGITQLGHPAPEGFITW